MPTLTITIDMNNAAFVSDAPDGYEVSRILRRLGESVELNGVADACPQTLWDTNGNRIGKAEIRKDGEG